MAVSASSTVSNSMTPTPLDRPPSNRTSAWLTLPVVWKSSTRSSFEVDQGSCEPTHMHAHDQPEKERHVS